MDIQKYDSPANDGIIYEFNKKDKLVGGAKIEIKDDCLYLKALYIKPEFRQKKYGSFILKHIEEDNKDSISRIECKLLLFSNVGFENIVRFYEENGFTFNIFTMEKILK